MIQRPLLACTAIALLVHGVAACLFVGGGRAGAAAAATASPVTLTLLAPRPAAPAIPPQEDPPAVTAKPEPHVTRVADHSGEAGGIKPAGPAPEAGSPRAASKENFLSPADLDVAALPRSAPDITMIGGLMWSGVPMRLRLFVNATGKVVDVAVLQTADTDDVVDKVKAMFLATAFIPGRAHGVDVASYKDIELDASVFG
jgi:hypothetical protein